MHWHCAFQSRHFFEDADFAAACVTNIQVEQPHENEANFAVSFPSTSVHTPVPHISSMSTNAAESPVEKIPASLNEATQAHKTAGNRSQVLHSSSSRRSQCGRNFTTAQG